MEAPLPFHRLFGMSWQDFFRGTPVEVEAEKDLSLQQQRLDVLILRRGPGPIGRTLPAGMEELAAHNLITFKSMHEALDEWALCELIGHLVAYRKLASPSTNDLLPLSEFRLFAVASRRPRGLSGRVPVARVSEGVYDIGYYLGAIRLVVANELPQERPNALVQVFAADDGVARFGVANYEKRWPETCTLFEEMAKAFAGEGPSMEEVIRRLKDEMLPKYTPDELRARLTPEQRLEGLTAEQMAARLTPEQRLAGLTREQILAALPPEVREALRRGE